MNDDQRNRLCRKPAFRRAFIVLVNISLILGCASSPSGLTLDDYKSRYWKGTYYFSVKNSPTSIKCSIDANYQSSEDVPVLYQGQDATLIFTASGDLSKINDLKEQCYKKSRAVFAEPVD